MTIARYAVPVLVKNMVKVKTPKLWNGLLLAMRNITASNQKVGKPTTT